MLSEGSKVLLLIFVLLLVMSMSSFTRSPDYLFITGGTTMLFLTLTMASVTADIRKRSPRETPPEEAALDACDIDPPIITKYQLAPCPICFEATEEGICVLPCQHKYHVACIGEWFKHKQTCPVCKRPVLCEL